MRSQTNQDASQIYLVIFVVHCCVLPNGVSRWKSRKKFSLQVLETTCLFAYLPALQKFVAVGHLSSDPIFHTGILCKVT